MNKQQLAARIWRSANKMRSKIEANEYKDYILGFIFYMFLSNQEVEFLKKDGWEEDDMKSDLNEEHEEEATYCREKLGYFIPYEHLFSTWLGKGRDFTADNVTIALFSFERNVNPTHIKVFDKIFHTLQTGLSKLGDNPAAQTSAVRDLIALIKDIPTDGKQDYDVLGFIYEYLISNFAANAGKKAGEFYTPHEVSIVMSEIIANHLKGRQEIEIYDPTSGSGSLLINIGKSVGRYIQSRDNIKYYAQELKENTYNLTRMNLVMRGIIPSNITVRNGDTLADDWPLFEDGADGKPREGSYTLLRVDAVVANPPYSQSWDPSNRENDPRFKRYGLAPSGKADYAFLLHNLYHIKPDGIVTIVLPHGVLFRGGEEEKIRRNLIENNNIDAIIGLPANIFFGTGIPTIIMVLKQKRENTDVLIIDASKGFEKVGKNNKLRACDIKRIADTVAARKQGDGIYSRLVSREEIRKNDYNLNIPRYVDSSEKPESYDIHAIMFGGIPNSEIDELADYWREFPTLRGDLFQALSPTSSKPIDEGEIASVIEGNADVIRFKNAFASAFSDFRGCLKKALLDDVMGVNPVNEETVIGADVAARLSYTTLIDPYEAYQMLDNEWGAISSDLETIQTEGFDSVRLVDANMVVKTKGKEEVEVQEGWKGHVLPFELVQRRMLAGELETLSSAETEISTLESTLNDALESIEEDDRNDDIYDSEKESFLMPGIAKLAKQYAKAQRVSEEAAILRYEEESLEWKVLTASVASDKLKVLKKKTKVLESNLIAKTKDVIESLSDEQCYELLEEKWISPIDSALASLPASVVASLTKKVQNLLRKYDETLTDIDNQIDQVGGEIAAMIDDLTGSLDDMSGLMEFKASLGLGSKK